MIQGNNTNCVWSEVRAYTGSLSNLFDLLALKENPKCREFNIKRWSIVVFPWYFLSLHENTNWKIHKVEDRKSRKFPNLVFFLYGNFFHFMKIEEYAL